MARNAQPFAGHRHQPVAVADADIAAEEQCRALAERPGSVAATRSSMPPSRVATCNVVTGEPALLRLPRCHHLQQGEAVGLLPAVQQRPARPKQACLRSRGKVGRRDRRRRRRWVRRWRRTARCRADSAVPGRGPARAGDAVPRAHARSDCRGRRSSWRAGTMPFLANLWLYGYFLSPSLSTGQPVIKSRMKDGSPGSNSIAMLDAEEFERARVRRDRTADGASSRALHHPSLYRPVLSGAAGANGVTF